MPTVEGAGIARQAWQTYSSAVGKVGGPIIDPFAKRMGANVVSDLLGFWLVWQLEGGFAGLERMGMGRTTIFRRVKRFRQVFGKHPDEFSLSGVSIDVEAYWATKSPPTTPATR
jgi:hypothetical protein